MMDKTKRWAFASVTVMGSPEWRKAVKNRLAAGFGAEDIAIWLDCHQSHVRAEIAALRADGTLAGLYNAP